MNGAIPAFSAGAGPPSNQGSPEKRFTRRGQPDVMSDPRSRADQEVIDGKRNSIAAEQGACRLP